ncbi:MAG: preprotein translocase subunit YajC [Bacteroidales bacterium]
MNNLSNLLLMAPQGENQSPYSFFIMLIAMFAVLYFFMIRPQQKKQKDLKKFREGLKNGDKVITLGGIYGKIVETSDRTVIMEVEGKMRLKVDKSALISDPGDIETQKQ